jgi:hypothetical protein
VSPTSAEPAPPYVARFGFSPRLYLFLALWGMFAVAGGVVTVWFASTGPGEPLQPGLEHWIMVAMPAGIAVFFGGALFVWLTAAVTGAVALRVDERGVGLGRPPFAPTRAPRLALVPWSDIESIVVFRQQVPKAGRMRYLGLRLHPGVAPPAGTPKRGSVRYWLNRSWGDVRGETASVSRTVQFWELDTTLLRGAVGGFAPQVPVRELDRLL